MNRRSLSCNWTGEDRRTCAKWGRAIAVFYGCMTLLVLGIIALTKPSRVVPNEASDGDLRDIRRTRAEMEAERSKVFWWA